jgi:hypothetical protein
VRKEKEGRDEGKTRGGGEKTPERRDERRGRSERKKKGLEGAR